MHLATIVFKRIHFSPNIEKSSGDKYCKQTQGSDFKNALQRNYAELQHTRPSKIVICETTSTLVLACSACTDEEARQLDRMKC